MTTEDLQRLLTSKSFRLEVIELTDTTLRLFLQDEDGNCALLAIEPRVLVLPDESVLDYSWQDVSAELGVPEHLYDLATRVGPDFEKGEMPSLFK